MVTEDLTVRWGNVLFLIIVKPFEAAIFFSNLVLYLTGTGREDKM